MLRRFGMLAVLVFAFTLTVGAVASDSLAYNGDTAFTAGSDEGDKGDAKKPEVKKRKERPYAKKLQQKISKPGPPPKKPKYKPWGKVITRDHEKHEGLVTIYTKQEDVYFVLKEDDLDKPMLAITSLSQGIGSNFVYGGLPIDEVLFDFHREEDHLQIRRLSVNYRAPGNEWLENALDLTYAESIIETLPIASEKDGKIAVEMNKFFLSDVSGMSMWLGAVLRQPVRISRDSNWFASIKNFPENMEIDTRLTYSPSRPQTLNLPNVPDPRFIQIGVQHSIIKLPEEPMMPRIADDRVGYFTTSHKDFTRQDKESFFVHYANRWRLEKKDPDAALSEPKKQIVYYLDRTIPEEYIPYMKEGVELWNRAFEKAGFKNAIVAKRAPTPEEDPEYDPEDARYNTIRWNVSDQVSYGAIGPSQVDPRTGEIISSDILFEHNMVANFGKAYRRYSGPRAALMSVDPNLKQLWMEEGEELADDINLDDIPQLRGKGHMFCALNDCMGLGGEIMRLSMLAAGIVEAGGDVPLEYVGDALRFVAAHEVGHALGLRHNFKSSGTTPYSKLNDKKTIEEIGMTGSVMDYPTPNIAVNSANQGYYYTPVVGTTDQWVIEWGYKPVDGDDPWAQSENLEDIASECTEKENLYGTDEDTYPLGAMDPRSNINDLSDDPLRWATDRMTISTGLLKNGSLEDRVVGEDGSYLALTNAVTTLYIQKYIATLVGIKNMGGYYTSRAHRGDGMMPMEPVPASKQQEALEFVLSNAFNPDSYVLSPEMQNKLIDDKMWSWQNNLFQPGRRFDFPMATWVMAVQNATLANMFNPILQARVVDQQYRVDKPFKLSNMYSGLTRTIWTNNATPTGQTAGMDRNLQRMYTDRLIGQMLTPHPWLPQDAVALSRLNLQRIQRTAQNALQRQGLDDETNAHLMETIARIDRALSADRTAGF